MPTLFKKIYWSTIVVSIILLITGLGLLFYQDIFTAVSKKTDSGSVIDKVKSFSMSIFNPEPLRFEGSDKAGSLSTQGILSETNRFRQSEGLRVLSYNAKLEQAAKAKLDDMFLRKYFAHISETGEGPAELATTADYRYIMVAENLALGNFSDDPELVKAWMDSPGHRANIMNKSYRDIGIAVGRGMYEGKLTWLAVQEFGIPSSLCKDINESQEVLISSNKEQLALWDTEIKKKYEELSHIPKTSPEYREVAIKYNEMVDRYNELSRRTKSLVANYNKDVQTYNQCIQNFNL
jgi:uncharacterized protein YkwD